MKPENESPDDESRITEITILPNGQLCIFGTSRRVLQMLDESHLVDASLRQRLGYLRRWEASCRTAASAESAHTNSEEP